MTPRARGADSATLFITDALILLSAVLLAPLAENASQVMTLIGVLSTASLALISWTALQRHSDLKFQAFLVLQAAFAYWYLLPMVLTAWRGTVYLEPNYRDFTAAQLRGGCLAVLLAKFISTAAYYLTHLRPPFDVNHLTRWLNQRRFRFPVLAVAAQLALGLIVFLVSGKSIITAILSSRSGGGIFPTSNFGTESLSFGFTFLLTSCSLLGFASFLLDDKRGNRWVSLVMATISFGLMALAISTRTTMLATVMPFVSTYAVGSRDRWRTWKVILCLLCIWLGAEFLLKSRQTGIIGEQAMANVHSGNLVNNDFFGELLYTMEMTPSQSPFSYESPLGLAAVGFVPRVIWPDKPYSKSAEELVRIRLGGFRGELTGNLLPGIIGQYWMSAGWIGVLMAGLWLGVATALADRIIAASNWYVRYLAFVFIWALFISFRTVALSLFLPAIICIATALFFSRSSTAFPTQCASV